MYDIHIQCVPVLYMYMCKHVYCNDLIEECVYEGKILNEILSSFLFGRDDDASYLYWV